MKTILLTGLVLAIFTLTSCGNAAPAGSAGAANTTMLSTNYDNALSVTLQLAVGTLKLKDTQNDIDAATAAELLPLWKAIRSLSSSDTAASAELDAVYNQIQETMAPEQIESISAMHLTREELGRVFQEMGIGFGAGRGGFGDMTPEQQATAQAARQSGQAPAGGGFPGGGVFGGPGPGGGFNPEQQQTASAQRGSTGGIPRVNPALLDAIIEFLQAKVQ